MSKERFGASTYEMKRCAEASEGKEESSQSSSKEPTTVVVVVRNRRRLEQESKQIVPSSVGHPKKQEKRERGLGGFQHVGSTNTYLRSR